MEITADRVKTLRERTGAGVMDCKRALEEAAGDFDRAIELIRQKGLAQAQKRAGREALQGMVETYVHGDGRIGVLVEMNCETDFVARTPDFRGLAHDVALQIAATSPSVIGNEGDEISTSPDDLPLLQQPFIKNPGQSIADLVRETVAKTGENIVIRRFARYELGS